MSSDPLSELASTTVAAPAGPAMPDEPVAALPQESPTALSALRRTAPLYVRRYIWGVARSHLRSRVLSSGSYVVSSQERPAATWAMRLLIACTIVALIVAFMLYLLALR